VVSVGKFLVGLVVGAVAVLAVTWFLPDPLEGFRQYGKFNGKVVSEWLEDGRTMRLENDFSYVDPDGKVWLAPANSQVDGASIPQAFWTLIGGPLEGQYRNASVVHDVACVEKSEPSENVHRMFYFACRCGGVSESKAKAMYYAVATFGPRWQMVYEAQSIGPKTVTKAEPVDIVDAVEVSEKDAKAILDYFEKNNPALDEVPELKIVE
jgi:uncharacterized protein DUF1353